MQTACLIDIHLPCQFVTKNGTKCHVINEKVYLWVGFPPHIKGEHKRLRLLVILTVSPPTTATKSRLQWVHLLFDLHLWSIPQVKSNHTCGVFCQLRIRYQSAEHWKELYLICIYGRASDLLQKGSKSLYTTFFICVAQTVSDQWKDAFRDQMREICVLNRWGDTNRKMRLRQVWDIGRC